jgi:hypothetical protein
MSGAGEWHVVKRLALDTGEAASFCGAHIVKLRRTLPPHAIACEECQAFTVKRAWRI